MNYLEILKKAPPYLNMRFCLDLETIPNDTEFLQILMQTIRFAADQKREVIINLMGADGATPQKEYCSVCGVEGCYEDIENFGFIDLPLITYVFDDEKEEFKAVCHDCIF